MDLIKAPKVVEEPAKPQPGLVYLLGGVITGSMVSFVFMTYLLSVNKNLRKQKRAQKSALSDHEMISTTKASSGDEDKFL